jgi:hypothetical protein
MVTCEPDSGLHQRAAENSIDRGKLDRPRDAASGKD